MQDRFIGPKSAQKAEYTCQGSSAVKTAMRSCSGKRHAFQTVYAPAT
jgi:hypothetical protein